MNKAAMLNIFFIAVIINSCNGGSTSVLQTATTGKISGVVKDGSGSHIPGALVVTEPPSSTVITGDDGTYSITNTLPGNYAVKATKPRVGSGTVSVAVLEGETTEKDIVINVNFKNLPPLVPYNPTPKDSGVQTTTSRTATGSVTLRWQCTDPDGDSLLYDIHLGKNPLLSDANIVAQKQKLPMLFKQGLDTGVVYYWQVTARDPYGNLMKSPVWSFRILSINYAVQFNDKSTYLLVDDSPDLHLSGGDFTIETWVYFNKSSSTWRVILTKDDTDNNTDYALMADRTTGKFRFQTRNFNTVLYSNTLVQSEQWYHLAVVQNITANEVRLYVNGELEASTSISGVISTNDSPLRIGCRANVITNYEPWYCMDGVLDEIRIWKTVRTQKQIQQAKNITLEGNESGLIALWNFSEGNGETTTDATGKKHNAMLINNPEWVVSGAPIK